MTTLSLPLINAAAYAQDKGQQREQPSYGLGSCVVLAQAGWRVVRGQVVAINKEYSTAQVLDVADPFKLVRFVPDNVFNVENHE